MKISGYRGCRLFRYVSRRSFVAKVVGVGICLALAAPLGLRAAPPGTSQSESTASLVEEAGTDFLSDDAWRQLPRPERQRVSQRAFLAKLEPTGQPSVEKVDLYVERYKQSVLFDGRLAVFSVRARVLDSAARRIALHGEVSLQQYRSGLVSALQALGFEVAQNNVELLPATSFGDRIYAIATTVSATMRREPRDRAEQVNSVALGWPLRLLRPARPDDISTRAQAGLERVHGRIRRAFAEESRLGARPLPDVSEWLLAQSAEGYVGFVRREDITQTSEYHLPHRMLLSPTTATLSNGTKVVLPTSTGLRESGNGHWTVIVGTDAVQLSLPENDVSTLPPTLSAERIVEVARPLLGTKYVWGGVTNFGIDCSGFTQFVYRCAGLHLPRDAEEQAIVGFIVGYGRDVVTRLQPGDLIFFTNDRGKISHVAISLGGEKIIHSSQRDVHLDSLTRAREDGEPPLADRIVYARRIIGW